MRLWLWSAEDGILSEAVTAEMEWTCGARATEDGESVGLDGRRMGGAAERTPGSATCNPVDEGAIPGMPGNGLGTGLEQEPMFSLRYTVFESWGWRWQVDGGTGGLGTKVCCLVN